MAKKLVVAHIKKASESLKKRKIEHVLVEHVDKDGDKADAFLVVMNKDYHNAKAVILADGCTILKTKNVRHYEDIALSHEHYQPTFDCTCRNCGKTFKSVVKEQVWCSAACKKEFRNKKKTV
jgi:hypothetical protein